MSLCQKNILCNWVCSKNLRVMDTVAIRIFTRFWVPCGSSSTRKSLRRRRGRHLEGMFLEQMLLAPAVASSGDQRVTSPSLLSVTALPWPTLRSYSPSSPWLPLVLAITCLSLRLDPTLPQIKSVYAGVNEHLPGVYVLPRSQPSLSHKEKEPEGLEVLLWRMCCCCLQGEEAAHPIR